MIGIRKADSMMTSSSDKAKASDRATLDDMMMLLRWSVRRCDQCLAPAHKYNARTKHVRCDDCATSWEFDLPEAEYVRRLAASGIYLSRVRP